MCYCIFQTSMHNDQLTQLSQFDLLILTTKYIRIDHLYFIAFLNEHDLFTLR